MIEPQITTYDEAKRLGKRLYCTGKPCPKGHLCDRRVASRGCVECEAMDRKARYAAKRKDPAYMAAARKRAKQWAEKNPEKYRANQARWRKESGAQYVADNRERIRAADRKAKKKQREANPNFDKEYHQRRYKNPAYRQKCVQRTKKWRKENPEHYKAMLLEWKKNNPDRAAAIAVAGVANRRARLKAGGKISSDDIRSVRARLNCAHCGNVHAKMEVDHIVALSKGGTNHISNLQLLCRPCNRSKWTHDFGTWAAERISQGPKSSWRRIC